MHPVTIVSMLNTTSEMIIEEVTRTYPVGDNHTDPDIGIIDNDKEGELRMKIALVAYTEVLAAVIVIGVVGNLLNILVLSQRNMKALGYIYLRYLAVSDTCALLLDSTYAANLYAAKPKSNMAAAVYGAYIEFTLKQSFNAFSTLLILAITIERYISMCHPLKAKIFLTRNNLHISAALLGLMAICFNLPRIWERTIEKQVMEDASIVYKDKVLSPFSQTPYYQFHRYLYVAIFQFLPLLLLFALNIRIALAFKQFKKQRAALTNNTDRKQHAEQSRVTALCLAVATMFLVLVLPTAFTYILQSQDTLAVFVFTCCADVLGEMNFGVNFYLYCFCSGQFRLTFKKVFCGWLSRNRVLPESTADSTNTQQP